MGVQALDLRLNFQNPGQNQTGKEASLQSRSPTGGWDAEAGEPSDARRSASPAQATVKQQTSCLQEAEMQKLRFSFDLHLWGTVSTHQQSHT